MKTLELEKFGTVSMEERKIHKIDDWPEVKRGICRLLTII